MTPSDVKTVVANLDDFIELPDGIDRLRKAVLTLAVSGKLVPQDLKEGTAEELYTEIQKIRQHKSSKKKVEDATLKELPYQIPASWKLVKVSDVYEVNPRNDIADDISVSFVPMTKVHSEWSRRPDIDEERQWKTVKKGYTHLKEGDVLLAKITPCFENGKSGIALGLANGFGAGTTELHVFRDPSQKLVPEYLLALLRSAFFVDDAIKNMTGTAGQKRVPTKFVENFPLPLPPAPEQERIVKRVNELMKQLDELDARKRERDEVRARLARSAMRELGLGNKTLALELLPELVKMSADVLELEQSLLTLAVSGKLAPQDSKDGVAKEKGLAPIPPEEIPFEIPQSWEWRRLGEVTNYGKTEKCKPAQLTEGTWVLELEDMEKDGGALLSVVRYPNRRSLSDKNVFRTGYVLYGKLRPYLNKVLVAHEDGVSSSELMPIRWEGSPDYLRLVLLSGYFSSYVNQRTYGMKMPRLGTQDGRKAPIPVPPLAEQKRIVAKVNEIQHDIARLRELTK